ncbi:unnamed protein product [Clavelina lepadiformis]|uniref:Nuclear-export cofactor Arc1-like N-terminal domain-containing protein n=1 Tax=Clavelina lepadiformis TaxID=159417 RepID=A0ABP0FK76_CLALP
MDVHPLKDDLPVILHFIDKAGPINSTDGPSTTIIKLAEFCPNFINLNGKTALNRAVVWEWLEKRLSFENGSAKKLCKSIEERLQGQVYIAGNDFTIADVVLFHCLKPYFCDLTHSERQTQFVNSCRWFEHIQHTSGIMEDSKKIAFLKNNIYV